MDKSQSKFLSVHYQLYTVNEQGEKELEEQTTREHPFEFISGFGIALDSFESRLKELEAGSLFDFTLTPEEAFGAYDENGVHKLSRNVFCINGKFDHANILPGAVITLLDEEEHRFMAHIKKVEEDGVTVDTNHPLAGKTLNFTGLLIENREATLDEIKSLLAHMGQDECGCGNGGGCCGHHKGEGECGGCGGCH